MKLLVSWMRELGTYVSREFHYTMRELLEEHGWRHVEPWVLSQDGASVRDRLLQSAGEIPEVILFWETYELFNAIQPALRDLGCRLALFADDLHSLWGQESRREGRVRAFTDCDLVLSSYGYAFDEFYPELRGRKRVTWAPHAASPDFVLPMNDRPEDAILLSGFIGSLYPLRMRVKALQEEGRCAVVRQEHPGYREGYDYQNDLRIGAGYARTIHRFRAAFTDALTFRYVVAKYFEIPATGALLVADGAVSGPLRELGFVENVHYVAVGEENLEERMRYVLDERNREEIDAMRQRGQQLVLNAHRTCDRARLIDRTCLM
jgi:Glycosyl transferases group 1